MSIDGQGHFFTIYFPGLYVLCFTRPRYQVSVYRTIGPLVKYSVCKFISIFFSCFSRKVKLFRPYVLSFTFITFVNLSIFDVFLSHTKQKLCQSA